MKRARSLTLAMVVAAFMSCRPPSGLRITEAEYGTRWPFTVPSGTLECQRESMRSSRQFVTLSTGNGIMYGLNGSAKDFGFPSSASIQKPGTTGADLLPIITRGLTLCERR